MLPQNCVVLCRWKRPLCQSVLLKPFRPIRSSDARLVEIRAEGEEVNVINSIRIVAALLAAACWFMSARVRVTRIKPGLEELDKVPLLASDLQRMGKWNAAAASFACVAAFADALIALG